MKRQTPAAPDPLDELAAREARARAMGGADKLARQHAKGRLDARQRIARLLDGGAFDEHGLLAASDMPAMAERTPADGKVCGWGAIDARPVFVSADDVTVFAGAGGRVGVGKQYEGMKYAVQKGYPCVHLGDAGGARVPDIMGPRRHGVCEARGAGAAAGAPSRTRFASRRHRVGGAAGMMSMVYPIKNSEPRQRRVPLVTAIMGECFGGAAWTASLSDIVIQVKGTAMCVGGPSILEIATGEKASTEELGGWELHAKVTGQVDLFAEDEAECLALIRRSLAYLPSSARELPPRLTPLSKGVGGVAAGGISSPTERLDQIQDLVPSDPRQVYDMHKLIDAVCDESSVLELKPYYDGSLITTLARIDGRVVGVLANNPKVMAGAMGPGACEKAVSFICLCDSFHIPLVFLHDTPGFFVGRRAEEGAMPLRIMNWIEALHQSTVPRISVIVRKSYGMAHCNMAGGNMGCDALLAWPGADISFMAPAVALNVVHGRKLTAESDRAAMLEEISRANAPWDAAARGYIHRVIDPRDTRIELARALARAAGPDGQGGRSRRNLANWPRMA